MAPLAESSIEYITGTTTSVKSVATVNPKITATAIWLHIWLDSVLSISRWLTKS